MCLEYVEEKHRKPYKGEGVGYKVMDFSRDHGLYFRYFPNKNIGEDQVVQKEMRCPTGVWVKSVEKRVWLEEPYVGAVKDKYYPSGFHIYTVFDDQPLYRIFAQALMAQACIVKVRYRGVKAVGFQDGLPVVVADEMIVPRSKGNVPRRNKKRG
jgi:hypothetical protein